MSQEAIEHIKATLEAYGPDEAVAMTQKTWANLRKAMQSLVEQARPVSTEAEWIESACALIKAADDAAADGDYMLDSNDCIKVLRGEWKGPLMNDQPAVLQPAQQGFIPSKNTDFLTGAGVPDTFTFGSNQQACEPAQDGVCESLDCPNHARSVEPELSAYDAGLLSDFGGGNVDWWQDYIRAELGRAHEHYQSQIPGLLLPPQAAAGGKVPGCIATRSELRMMWLSSKDGWEFYCKVDALVKSQPAPAREDWGPGPHEAHYKGVIEGVRDLFGAKREKDSAGESSKPCSKCGDADPASTDLCTVSACGMREGGS